MASSAWSIYNEAKKYMLDGTLDLDTNTLRIKLCGSASNAATLTLSTFASVGTEASGGGYGHKSLTAVSVTSILSAKSYSLDCTAVIFSAVSTNIAGVKFAVIGVSAGKVIAYCKLSSSQFSVTAGNTLTITPHASGIFSVV